MQGLLLILEGLLNKRVGLERLLGWRRNRVYICICFFYLKLEGGRQKDKDFAIAIPASVVT